MERCEALPAAAPKAASALSAWTHPNKAPRNCSRGSICTAKGGFHVSCGLTRYTTAASAAAELPTPRAPGSQMAASSVAARDPMAVNAIASATGHAAVSTRASPM